MQSASLAAEKTRADHVAEKQKEIANMAEQAANKEK